MAGLRRYACVTRVMQQRQSVSVAGGGYLYLLQEREFVKSGEDVYKVGRTDRDVSDRLKEYPKGSRLLYCEHVPRESVVRLEGEVLRSFRRKFRARCDVGAESFAGPWDEMVAAVREVISSDRRCAALSGDVTRRTGCASASEYDLVLARFLEKHEGRLEGRLVSIEELERMFEEEAKVPLLREPLARACRSFGAAAHERLEVQFRARGENTLLDAAMHFRTFSLRRA